MKIILSILIIIILLNCLKKNNNLEGFGDSDENESNIKELKNTYKKKCKNFKDDNDDCGKHCKKNNYVLKKDEIDIDENTICLKNKSIIDKVNGVFEKIKNCDLCVYCKLLKNKLEIEKNKSENDEDDDNEKSKDIESNNQDSPEPTPSPSPSFFN